MSLTSEPAWIKALENTRRLVSPHSKRKLRLDPLGRPLFGMMIAGYSTDEGAGASLNPDVLTLVLKKEAGRRRELIPDGERSLKMEHLATLATLVGGLLPRSDGFDFLAKTEIAALIPNADVVDRRTYRDFVAATTTEAALAGFQPDILGERVVLDRLRTGSGLEGITKRLLLTAWNLEPDDLCDFILRAASDFPADHGIDILCDLPCQSEHTRAKWGWLVGDLIRIANRSDDRRTQRLLETLGTMARTYSGERDLQNALVRAELHLGNVFLFAEHNYQQASAWYDAAMTHAESGSDIEASVINNRGILYLEMQNEDEAFADWSHVIANKAASDEARACSLNNRADIFARRHLHQEAIRDRSEVLALKNTSPDRRYIALIRRSRSYRELGRIDEALRDLTDILDVEDIAPEQKSEARLRRGVLYRDLRRMTEASEDLEAVCSAGGLFSGAFASALVELAELARLTGDLAGARQYLDVATASDDAEDETIVEALIVWARVLADQGARADSEGIWRSVLANPRATARQRSIAENAVHVR